MFFYIRKSLKSIISVVFLSLLITNCSVATDKSLENTNVNKVIEKKLSKENEVAINRSLYILMSEHFQKVDIDQNMMNKIIKRYLDNLDYSHLYFLQSDVDMIQKKYVDDAIVNINTHNLEFITDIYQLHLQRFNQYIDYSLSLLQEEPDLNNNDKLEVDRKKAAWPVNISEAENLWKKRVMNDIVNLKLNKKNWADIKKSLVKRYNYYRHRAEKLTNDDITQFFLNAITREIDPHTSYLSPKALKRFEESMSLSMEGIGATLQLKDDRITISSFVKGGPAEKSKLLKIGDRIIGVGEKNGEIQDVIGWWLDDTVELIRGKKGTVVRLQIEPKNGSAVKIVEITRNTIKIEDSAVKLKVKEIDGYKIGILEIPSFYTNVSNDIVTLLRKSTSKQLQGLIIDLRNNGGGLLNEVVDMNGLFVGRGPVVQVRDSENIEVYNSDNTNEVSDYPILVLINRFSASASEIFAAAMQDYGRALIVGQNSYGKGTVQRNRVLKTMIDINLGNLGALQYTIQKFYRINGESTQLKGVKPDIVLPSIIDPDENGEAKDKNALVWDTVNSANYQRKGDPTKLVPYLLKQYKQRIISDPDYKVLQVQLAENKRKKKEKYLSLNYMVRKQEQEKSNKIYLDGINQYQKRQGNPVFKSIDDIPLDYEGADFYLDQSKQIMLDILKNNTNNH